MTTVLHSYFRSSCSYRVRIALNLKEISYSIVPVDLLNNEQSTEEYKKKFNPLGMVPTLEIDGLKLTQSLAIVDYLDATRRLPKLCSNDPVVRYKQLSLATLIGMDIQPLHNLRTLKKLGKLTCHEIHVKEEWIKYFLIRGFAAIEDFVSTNSTHRKFSVGDSVSVGDVCLAPQVYVAKRFGLDVSTNFPTVAEIYENLMTIPAFLNAHPHSQPDCPEELRSDLSISICFVLTTIFT
jgi:maleylacetoacetate isomerase